MQTPFRFQTLLNIRRSQLDLRRQILAQLEREEHALNVGLRNLQRERMAVLDDLRARGKVGKVELAVSRAGHQRARDLRLTSRQWQRRIDLLGAQSNLCRQAVLELARVVKLLEKLQQTQTDQWRSAESRRESLYAQEQLVANAYPRSSP